MNLPRSFPARCRVLSLGVVALLSLADTVRGAVTLTQLRCEYRDQPIALDTLAPRLSWALESAERDVRQSAYRVLVASTRELLDQEVGDLWDSGLVESAQSTQIAYAGRALASAQLCYWKVQIWDQAGQPSAWSPAQRWQMGLLAPWDWTAKWIGYEFSGKKDDAAQASDRLGLEGAAWLWLPAASLKEQPAQGLLEKTFTLPANSPLRYAEVQFTNADSAARLVVNGAPVGEAHNERWLVARHALTTQLHPGANTLRFELAKWPAGSAGVIGRLVVFFEDGSEFSLVTDATWQARANETATPSPAGVVGHYGDKPWGTPRHFALRPAPFFRKAFALGKPLRQATLFATALGVYELRLNGRAIDTDVLSPGWTDYSRRVHYRGYDVTTLLQSGDNVIGAILGDGWYAGFLGYTHRRNYYGPATRLRLQLRLDYADGSTATLGTDESWKAAEGPIRANDLQLGSVYDASYELGAWDRPGYNDDAWARATVDNKVSANLVAHPGEPIRRHETLTAKSVTEPRPGVYVFDVGQNIVGWARLRVQGAGGRELVLRHGEMLNADGTLFTANLRSAAAVDVFRVANDSEQTLEPSFTFHGFRYVEVTGLTRRPEPGDLAGVTVYSDLAQTGAFRCSDPLVNQLMANVLRSQKGNFLDVPLDCPQRDERQGWTADAQVFMKTACFNQNAPAFFTKWLVDLCADSQRADGAFGDVAPYVDVVSYGNTAWSDTGPICAWRMYEIYGDKRVLERHYPALVAHQAFLDRTSRDGVRGSGTYGDWLRLAGPQHSNLIGTAYYYYSTTTLSRIAQVLGRTQDATAYSARAEAIKARFLSLYLKDDGRLIDEKNNTGQTFYALAFGLDMIPQDRQSDVARCFADSIHEQNDHLATGFLGTPFVLFALQKAGHLELAYKLALNRTYPSWLQQVDWGATTMWERWDGWRPDQGFHSSSMNSFNHYWLGCIGEWLYTQVAGIDTEGPGFERINIRPEIVAGPGGLDWAEAHYDSPRGRVASAWKIKGDQFELNVTVPANSTATLYLPARDASEVTEGGAPAAAPSGVRFVRFSEGRAIYTLGSGDYRFTSTLPARADTSAGR